MTPLAARFDTLWSSVKWLKMSDESLDGSCVDAAAENYRIRL